ncbi:MAG TPA: serine protease [Vicinamibacterales bacterium]|nr:serine protease [Vicinamibacterales bacterium]
MEEDRGTFRILTEQLDAALRGFEWARAETLCDELVRAIRRSPIRLPPDVGRCLSLLRRKRRFGCIARVAEAAIHIGEASVDIRRQYAQALIDQGLLVAAEHVLRDTIPTAGDDPELFELQGLMGRVYKQWYVTAPVGAVRRRETLEQAVEWYLRPYRVNPLRNYWHGINVVALVARGERDSVSLSSDQTPAAMASDIVAALERSDGTHPGAMQVWEVATLMEAFLALGRLDLMFERAREYAAHPDADVFEVASTLRQLMEVWNLTDDNPPGSALLPVLRAKLLREEGGSLLFAPRELALECARTAQPRLIHGADGFQTLQWYRRGLDCCAAVARIETDSGRGIGTGWLVRSGECLPGGGSELLLMTNAHVISPADRPFRGALLPAEAIAHFQLSETRIGLGDVVWSSPADCLDCTLVRLKTQPSVAPLALSASPVEMREPPPRMYMIGYPGGRDVQFSLQDNHLVGVNDRLLHYRTPTEGGSSGSPVFNASWEVVALHHAGSSTLSRIDGRAGTYEANEGIRLSALLSAARATVPAANPATL